MSSIAKQISSKISIWWRHKSEKDRIELSYLGWFLLVLIGLNLFALLAAFVSQL